MLAVGPGGLDKDGKRVSCSVAVGDKVLIPQVSFSFLQNERSDQYVMEWVLIFPFQYGGSPVKVGEEEYSLFRDHEYEFPLFV